MNKQITNIANALLSTGLFSAEFTKAAQVKRALAAKLDPQKPVRIVYGETYDQYGMTIDSLKYYFILSYVHTQLKDAGFNVTSHLIVGDIASIKNKNVQNKNALLDAADERIAAINKIVKVYHLPITTVKMSELFEETSFQRTLETARTVITGNALAQQLLQKTVLKNRVKQELISGYEYAVEEVALILGYDIKVGPPRERFYDQLASLVETEAGVRAPVGLYVNPTYPLGMNFDYFIANPEIETYGLTPYKAGSNKLMEHRIILSNLPNTNLDALVTASFVPIVPGLANPVQDLYDIALLAKAFLGGTPFTRSELAEPQLKAETLSAVKAYIQEPLYA